MNKPSDIPLNESVLVGFWDNSDYPELPIGALREAFPGYGLNLIGPREDGDSIDSDRPIYLLKGPEGPEAINVLIGYRAVGAGMRKYTCWDDFKLFTWDALKRARPCYGSRNYKRYLLRYVDVFDGESIDELSSAITMFEKIAYPSSSFQRGSLSFKSHRVLNGLGTDAFVNYDFEQLMLKDEDTGEEEERLVAVISFDVVVALKTPFDEDSIRQWLELAHNWQKKLLWDALTPEYRETVGMPLFDDDERSRFNQEQED